MTDKKGILGRLAIFITALIWGTSFVILKTTLTSVGTMWILAIRFSVSAVLLAAFAIKKIGHMGRHCFIGSVLMGVCLAIAYIVQTYGLLLTSPGKNAFLTSTYCVLVPFLAWLIYKRRPNASNIIGAVICVAGIGLVSLSSGFDKVNLGDMLTLGCGIFYALQIIIMENYAKGNDTVSISAVQFAVAALICWAGALLFEPAPVNVPQSAWMSIAYLSIMCTAVCFFLEAWGIKYTPAPTAAVIMTMESVFGTLVSVIFYRESLTTQVIIGFIFILFAVITSESGHELFSRKIYRKTSGVKG